MKRFQITILVALFAVAIIYFVTWWTHRPERTIQEFAGYVSRGQYDAAAQMLNAPSAITEAANGDLTLVDRSGESTNMPAAKLPFKVGGGKSDGPGDFSMIALGSSTNGVLDTPAVIMYLSVSGGRITIEQVDP